jgi:hypothetical protein
VLLRKLKGLEGDRELFAYLPDDGSLTD